MDRPADSTAVSQAGTKRPGPDACGKRVPSHGQRATASLSGAGAPFAGELAFVAKVCGTDQYRPPRQCCVSPFRRRRFVWLRNQESRITGFAAGGKNGLWFSHTGPSDRRLVLAESAIDALSHAVLFPDAEDRTRYASLGGNPNAQQPGLVRSSIARLPDGAEIVAAFDADEAGAGW